MRGKIPHARDYDRRFRREVSGAETYPGLGVNMSKPVFIKDFIWAHFSKTKLIKLIGALFLLVIFFLVYVLLNLPDGKLYIFFFDVGQGESIFIQTPANQKVLIDGGPDERVLNYLGRILPFYNRTLDLVVLTHPHADHVTGLIEVIKRYKVNLILANKTDYQTPETRAFWEAVEERKVEVRSLTMGERISLGEVQLGCLWPPKGRVEIDSGNPNLESIILRLSYGNFSALLTGDAEDVVQQQLVLLDKMPPETTVLKVPHQGAEDCCDKEFIRKLNPQLAIIPVGRNRFGHPSKKAITLLGNLGVKILRTDQDGTIEVVSDGGKWWYKID